MKRTLLISLALLMFTAFSFAGGIVTNTNQSAAYVRMLARDASTGIDAVYFNPAGLMLLKNGFHLSVSNQSIWQDRTIKSDYPYLNNNEYKGKVTAPLFPSVYAAYKLDRLAVSFGFNPVGGGGGAVFDKGLPSFEYSISDLVPSLQAMGQQVTGYKTDIYFEGKSVYWGAQLGVSATVTDNVSVFAGLRFVSASTSYLGHLKDNTLLFGSTEVAATDFFTGVQAQYTTGAQQAAAAATNFSQYPAAAVMPAEAAAAAGLPEGTTFGQAAAIMTQAAQTYTASAAKAGATATLLADQEADVTQKGTGITPIFGVNFNLLDQKLDIGLKYELPTHMKVTNNTTKDVLGGFAADGTPITMFPDGESFYNDMPAMLSIGASYAFGEKFSASLGYHTYFDKAADYGKQLNGEYVDNTDLIDHNYNEIALGLEYKFGKRFLVSAGFLRAMTGVNETYQSDLSNSLNSNTGAFGFAVNVTPNVQLNLGALYSVYEDGTKHLTHMLGTTAVPVVETYSKGNLVVAIGADISFGK
jgi:long-subunit fatty acid transport protein